MANRIIRPASATGPLMAIALCICQSDVLAQPTEKEVASKLAKLGCQMAEDSEGNVSNLWLGLSSMRDEDFQSIDLSVLGQLKSLTVFQNATERSFAHLRKSIPPGLQRLTIRGARIGEQGIISMLQTHQLSLESVDIYDTKITDRTLVEIGKLKSLISLGLGATNVTDRGMKSLGNLQELLLLDLNGTTISDAGLAEIKNITPLSALWLEKTKVTDAGILQLSYLANLKSLYVSSTKVTETGKTTLQGLLPDLRFRVVDYRQMRR